jgi:hypothetical protein
MERAIALAAALVATSGSASPGAAPDRVLIVMDELEQMQALAASLGAAAGLAPEITGQEALPPDWTPYAAVLAYVHGDLQPETERRMIDYTRAGGRLVVLHHTISSGKLRNEHWFDFLGVALPGASESRNPAPLGGHYAWREHVALTVVNLAPDHYITSHEITWPEVTRYASSDRPSVEREYPSLTLEPSEAYMNVHFTDGRHKTVLLGFAYLDDRNGVLFMQDREGWLKPAGDGWIVYLQMGHFVEEWRHPVVAQLVLNAIRWRPNEGP